MPRMLQKMGPVIEGQLTIKRCAACEARFQVGEYLTLVSVGPGEDPDARKACREGRAYNGVAVPVHWACATGEE